MYRVNDTVVYGRVGVCRICEISEFDFTGAPEDYYVLRPLYTSGKENQVIYVPKSNKLLTGRMRAPLSEPQIMEIVDSVPEYGLEWITDESVRKRQYAKIMEDNNTATLAAVIKSIHLYKTKLESGGKKLHLCDEKMMADAQKILCDEFSCVYSISEEEILPFILKNMIPEKKKVDAVG